MHESQKREGLLMGLELDGQPNSMQKNRQPLEWKAALGEMNRIESLDCQRVLSQNGYGKMCF